MIRLTKRNGTTSRLTLDEYVNDRTDVTHTTVKSEWVRRAIAMDSRHTPIPDRGDARSVHALH